MILTASKICFLSSGGCVGGENQHIHSDNNDAVKHYSVPNSHQYISANL